MFTECLMKKKIVNFFLVSAWFFFHEQVSLNWWYNFFPTSKWWFFFSTRIIYRVYWNTGQNFKFWDSTKISISDIEVWHSETVARGTTHKQTLNSHHFQPVNPRFRKNIRLVQNCSKNIFYIMKYPHISHVKKVTNAFRFVFDFTSYTIISFLMHIIRPPLQKK